MKKLIAKKDFILNGIPYIAGDEVKTKDIAEVRKLNEKGFIETLNFKELVILERNLKEDLKKEE